MHTRAVRAALLLVAFAALSFATVADAAPTQLTVRIEGEDRTLFEGPIVTDGHDVQAASDAQPRQCDATNNGAESTPTATPTAAAVDAMAILGEGFDGDWYPGFDDYFITRWGPDGQLENGFAYWGILVNGAFTSVGGCQLADEAGDEVLWVYDAFSSRPFLRLAAAADPSAPPGPALPTAFVDQDQPLALSVKSYTGAMDGSPESILPAAGALVAPVDTDPVKGYQEVDTGDPSTVTTMADGTVSVAFATPGWHRLKAAKAGLIRSNRLDVCVRPAEGGDCGPLPLDAQVRVPPQQPLPPLTVPSPLSHSTPPTLSGSSAASTSAPSPPSAFALARVKAGRVAGSAILTVVVPGPGHLALSGGGVKRTSTWVDAAGSVALAVRAKGKALSRLRERGKVTVAVAVSFRSDGGVVTAARRSVVLKLGSIAG